MAMEVEQPAGPETTPSRQENASTALERSRPAPGTRAILTKTAPPAPSSSARRVERAWQAPPTPSKVKVHIERLEIFSEGASPEPAPRSRKPAPRPAVSLDDYLRRRGGGR